MAELAFGRFRRSQMKSLRKFINRSGRTLAIVASVLVMLYGVTHLVSGRVNYENYWGGVVFAPFTIVVGALFLYIAVFHYDRVGTAWRDKKARRVRFPADDFRKW